ncbi:constitutive coactivator of PPAR-gamma-like protein 1 homolog [Lycorma delicatula]|uniref:constitutive coactivator of PPAR-gamma-like protein 1 homolog n=1 Tax=Lycorma delicatula TaxID=130591 RepID=UPI003F511131
MGIQDLQTFLESGAVSGSCVPVDLVRIAKSMAQRSAKQAQKKGSPNMLTKFSLVVDGECCLDRLYGGYFSDWACGGQWNRMVTFLSQFVSSLQKANIDLVVFFNGCVEQQRMNEWIAQQQRTRQKVNQVLKHINTKGTPPPKVWWTPPVCLRTAIRMVLRHLDVSVVCTMDDHRQEVIAYCRENNYHGLIADDAEYAAFDPPRYFSARQLKLTYKGSLESKEYNLQELNKGLGLNSEKLCVLAALLGNYLLTEHDLLDVYKKQGINQPLGKIQGDQLVKALANLVKSLPSVDNLDATAAHIFDSPNDPRAARLKQSIQYYLDGTKDGFLNYRSAPIGKRGRGKKVEHTEKQTTVTESNQEPDLDTSKLASETAEREMNSLKQYKEATAGMTPGPEIIIDHASKENDNENDIAPLSSSVNGSTAINGRLNNLLSSSSSSSSSGATSPARGMPDSKKTKQTGKPDSDIKTKVSSVTTVSSPVVEPLPPVPPEVMRTVSERHSKGLMSPCIYQILTQGEIKLPVVMEEEQHKEVPNVHHFYRPIRQMVYAILFNLHHHSFMATKNKEKTGQDSKPPEVKIKEWVWSKGNQFQRPEIVRAESLGWGVPTVQRLWFGTTVDDMRRRRRAYLTCMRSDSPLIVNYDYVPQHILIMATVLRYMMSFPDKKVLRRSELDAFIMTALSPELMNAEYNQDLQLPVVTSRGVQLATMFMQGVETALLVNDACGAPIPWLMCCPWLFFDGKLFHHQLARASQVKNLLELCDHRIRIVMKVEHMRQAILEGLNVQFARAPLPIVIQGPGSALHPGGPYAPPPGLLPAGMVAPAGPGGPGPRGLPVRGGISPRGLPRRSITSNSGGRLEIAGVVVGSWGPNYGLSQIGVNRPVMLQPQVTSVGAVTNFNSGPFRGGRPTFSTRGTLKGKGRGFRTQMTKKRTVTAPTRKDAVNKKTTTTSTVTSRGRGMTMVLPETGDTVLVSDVIGDDKKKKILINTGDKKAAGDLVNGQAGGGGGGDDGKDIVAGQFDDANIIDGVGMNGEGDSQISMKTPLIAATAVGKVDN